MISLLAVVLTVCAVPTPNWSEPAAIDPLAAAGSSRAGETPHPAVVRVIAPLPDGFSLGSGTLVGASRRYGLVVTNWHVVRDASGLITVVFPDGFRSGVRVLKTDRNWDLAALVIWRPHVDPVPISPYPPRSGDLLTIAGYGSGWYRAATGRCVEYVSPGDKFPAEMVELSAAARQGDSGGPILNSRGEVAGVLFGTAMGRTTGSYGGRVRAFLGSVVDDMQRADPDGTMIAQQTGPSSQRGTGVSTLGGTGVSPVLAGAARADPAQSRPILTSIPGGPVEPVPRKATGVASQGGGVSHALDGDAGFDDTRTAAPTAHPGSSQIASAPIPAISPTSPRVASRVPSAGPSGRAPQAEPVPPEPSAADAVPELQTTVSFTEILGTSTTEQAKTILAGIGLIFVIVFAMRTLGSLQARPQSKRRRS